MFRDYVWWIDFWILGPRHHFCKQKMVRGCKQAQNDGWGSGAARRELQSRSHLESSFEELLAFGFGHAFYGVAEGGAGGGGIVLFEKIFDELCVDAFVDFAEHPAVGFLDEVVGVGEVLFDDFEAGTEFVVLVVV